MSVQAHAEQLLRDFREYRGFDLLVLLTALRGLSRKLFGSGEQQRTPDVIATAYDATHRPSEIEEWQLEEVRVR